MSSSISQGSEFRVSERLRREPDVFLHLAQNSVAVAKSLRQQYLEISQQLAEKVREYIENSGQGSAWGIRSAVYQSSTDERITVCFIDGGIGEAEILTRVPLIVRGGIFRVKEGERDLEKRETFEFLPILIGDLEGGEKSRSDYSSVVRIIVELIAVWHVLHDTKYDDVDLIMLHGPLLYRLSAYTNHWLYKKDVETLTSGYPKYVQAVLDEYDKFCQGDPTPRDWMEHWRKEGKIRANYLIASLLSKIIEICQDKGICFVGVVERGEATEICRRIFNEMLAKDHLRVDDPVYQALNLDPRGQHSKNAEKIITYGNYNDTLMMGLVLNPSEYLPFQEADERYSGFSGELEGFGDYLKKKVPISYTYLKARENTLALRVEFPTPATHNSKVDSTMRKVYQYARLLPNYAFPIGLDVVDKFARVPKWMVEAYRKYILFNFARLPEEDSIVPVELERMLLFFHLQQRSLFQRPKP